MKSIWYRSELRPKLGSFHWLLGFARAPVLLFTSQKMFGAQPGFFTLCSLSGADLAAAASTARFLRRSARLQRSSVT